MRSSPSAQTILVMDSFMSGASTNFIKVKYTILPNQLSVIVFDDKIPKKVNSSSAKAGNVVITSALPYANGEIHLGHITSTYLPADILARYFRSTNHNVLFLCGSDDYGTPILIKD